MARGSASRTGDASRTVDLAALAPDETGAVLAGEGRYDPPTTALDAKGQGVPYATYGFAAQVAEVEVDTVLATVKVRRIVAAHDVGRAVNPTLVEGQIHGGIAQGLGLALMEEYIPGRTENLHDYLIPTVGDMPEIVVKLIEDPRARGALRRQGRRRARPRRHRAGDPRRDPPRHRRARHPRPRAAPPPARGASRAESRGMSADPLSPEARSNKFGAAEADGIVRCDACPVLCRIRPGRAGACSRYANEDGRLVRTDPVVLLRKARGRGRQARALRGGRVGRRAARSVPHLRHRHRLRHHLPGLQARSLHRLRRARRRRHRHRGDGGHLQLLRREGEDRHRPAPRPGARRGARRRRGGRPRHHRRIRLADALHRRRAPPHRRLQEGGQHHLRDAAPPLLRRARDDGDRGRPRGRGAGGPRAARRRAAGKPHARRLRLGDRRHLRQAMARPRG